MALPWSEAIRLASEFALSLGKRKDGSYKTVGEILSDGIKKYTGYEWITSPDSQNLKMNGKK